MTDSEPTPTADDPNDSSAPLPHVLGAEDDEYASAVRTFTGQGSPDLVVRPRCAEEVASAVLLAGERAMSLTVRAGGHSMAGLTTARYGMLIDLREMDAVSVDPGSGRVSIGGGAQWGEVARALATHGLALTAGDTAGVGVGGLTLAGGIGWMVRRFGLAIDALVGAQVVTAAGEILEVSDTSHPDLFWALRGGGGNFAVVTRFDFVAHDVPEVVFGTVILQVDDAATASGQVHMWGRLQELADDRLTTTFSLLPAMDGQPASAMLQICFAGDGQEASAAVAPFLQLGAVVSDDISTRPYAQILVEAPELSGVRIAQRNVFLDRLGETENSAIASVFSRGELMLSLRGLGGAVSRIDPNATAFAHRSAEAMLVATRMVPDTDTDTGNGTDEDNAVGNAADLPGWGTLAQLGSGAYVNLLDSATAADTHACYPGPTLRRLRSVSVEYDPENLFHRTLGVGAPEPGRDQD
ncbi:MAG: FAD-binding oxidoreductase [Pauljensenia sp.]